MSTLRTRLQQLAEHPRSRRLRERLWQYALLTRVDRPIGTYLLLWPTLWALWLAAEGLPDLYVLVVFILGAILMRAAGCAINDFADRNIDGHVARTVNRPLATGAVSPREALAVAAVLALAAFALVLTLNPLTVYLSFGAVFLAALYPFSKRFTHLPQIFLGAAFSWAAPMAFAAQTGSVPPLAWLVFIVNLVWTVAYDTMYAMADREDDLKIGVRSTAILFGEHDRVMVGLLQGMTLLGLVLIGLQFALGMWFYLSVAAAAAFFAWQQFLIVDRAPGMCFRAFLNNAWVGLVVLLSAPPAEARAALWVCGGAFRRAGCSASGGAASLPWALLCGHPWPHTPPMQSTRPTETLIVGWGRVRSGARQGVDDHFRIGVGGE